MPTKLFDTVTLYDATTAIAAVAAEDVEINLGAIADNVVVTFPASAVIGQCIGVSIAVGTPAFSVTGVGPVDTSPFPLSATDDSALWTWDGTEWQVVTRYRNVTPLFSAVSTAFPTDGTPLTPAAGQMLSVGLAGATEDVPVPLPDSAQIGQCIGLRVITPSVPAGLYGIVPPNVFSMRRTDESVFYTWDGGQWVVVINTPAVTVNENFDNDSLSGDELTFNHILNTNTPTVSIYDSADNLVPPGPLTWSLVAPSFISVVVTFDSGLLPLTGTWRISAVR